MRPAQRFGGPANRWSGVRETPGRGSPGKEHRLGAGRLHGRRRARPPESGPRGTHDRLRAAREKALEVRIGSLPAPQLGKGAGRGPGRTAQTRASRFHGSEAHAPRQLCNRRGCPADAGARWWPHLRAARPWATWSCCCPGRPTCWCGDFAASGCSRWALEGEAAGSRAAGLLGSEPLSWGSSDVGGTGCRGWRGAQVGR